MINGQIPILSFLMPHIIRELQLSLRAPVPGENKMIEKNLRVRIHALGT